MQKEDALSEEHERIGAAIVDSAYRVHTELGPGLLESVYRITLMDELIDRGFEVEAEVPVAIRYREQTHPGAFRADLIVRHKVVIELKAAEKLEPVHARQTLTYLRLLNLQLGYLINFGGATLKGNINRFRDDFHQRQTASP